jgi:glutamate-1-semialdehyde 2,1-aminomutase
MDYVYYAAAAGAGAWALSRGWSRLLLSRAKHPGMTGHPRMAVALSRLLPAYAYADHEIFDRDGAPADVARQRREGFMALASRLSVKAPSTLAASAELERDVSDVAFVNQYRVPFQFRDFVAQHLRVGTFATASDGSKLRDLDGNWSFDLGGAYGVNLFGADFYKRCIDRGVERARDLGLVLGPYHPIIADNVRRLKQISGMDEVSFHMSGTEAVMQAVRLARYHTGRSHAVRFTGAYHGWSDGIQAGPGNPRPVRELYTLSELSPTTLEVLRTRKDIACVLVNPIQAMHPNAAPASDSTLLASDRKAHYDRDAYRAWLQQLREVCTQRGIVLIFDEVFLGFRLAKGGVQEYFGVRADIVTYGKTLGGGLPVGVVCGKHRFMQRYRADRPADVCFARGTFNSHPYVMASMNEFLRYLDEPEVLEGYRGLDERWNKRASELNAALLEAGVPVRVENMTSVFATLYTQPGCYNWMYQYYLRDQGLTMSWIGTGRFIYSHDLSDEDFREITARMVRAGEQMKADGWWTAPGLTNAAIKTRLSREVMRAMWQRVLGQRPPSSGPALTPATSADAS